MNINSDFVNGRGLFVNATEEVVNGAGGFVNGWRDCRCDWDRCARLEQLAMIGPTMARRFNPAGRTDPVSAPLAAWPGIWWTDHETFIEHGLVRTSSRARKFNCRDNAGRVAVLREWHRDRAAGRVPS